jgi:hypothetical protein
VHRRQSGIQAEPGLGATVEQGGGLDTDVRPGRQVVAVAARDDHRQEVHAAAHHDDDQRPVVARRAERDLGGQQLRAQRRHADRTGTGDHPPPRETEPPPVLLRGQLLGHTRSLIADGGLADGGPVPQQLIARTRFR